MRQTANHCQDGGAATELPLMKQYSPGHALSAHSFYVLCKGLNSGKPLNLPTANCFEIQCKDADHSADMFWLCFSLWQTKSFEPLLRGSVIPFLTIKDFKKVITRICGSIDFNQDRRAKLVSAIDSINQLEEITLKKIKLIREYKLLMIRDMLR
jgi:hypothetical protein